MNTRLSAQRGPGLIHRLGRQGRVRGGNSLDRVKRGFTVRQACLQLVEYALEFLPEIAGERFGTRRFLPQRLAKCRIVDRQVIRHTRTDTYVER